MYIESNMMMVAVDGDHVGNADGEPTSDAERLQRNQRR